MLGSGNNPPQSSGVRMQLDRSVGRAAVFSEKGISTMTVQNDLLSEHAVITVASQVWPAASMTGHDPALKTVRAVC